MARSRGETKPERIAREVARGLIDLHNGTRTHEQFLARFSRTKAHQPRPPMQFQAMGLTVPPTVR